MSGGDVIGPHGPTGPATVRDRLTLHPRWQSTAGEEHSLDGQPWTFRYLPARYSKGRMTDPPGVCLSVTVSGSFSGSVLVCPEDAWDRAVRSIGLSQEFQTDTPDVDASFMLSGRIGDELGAVFRSPATHRILRELFALGFDRVECFNNEVRATCRPWQTNLPDAEPPRTFLEVAAALIRLKAGLSHLAEGAPTAESRFHHVVASPRPAVWVLAGFLASLACGLGLIATNPLSGGELFTHLAWPALAAALSTTVVVAILIRRYAFRGRTLIAFLVAACAVVFSASFTTLGYLNESLDRALPARHTGAVMQKWRTTGKSTSYHIRVPSWRPDHPSEDFTLSKDAWTAVRVERSTYVVHSKPGHFGIEWVVDRRLQP